MTLEIIVSENYLPCVECARPIPADIHAEELGMCLTCHYTYFDHEDELFYEEEEENN